MLQVTIELIRLPLRYTWKISRNASTFKQNFIVTVTDGTFTGKGEVAPNIRYQETPELVSEQFTAWQPRAPQNLFQASEIYSTLKDKTLCNALRFGIESACIQYLAAKEGKQVWQLLAMERPMPVGTSFSLPIMDKSELESFYKTYNLQRFPLLKLKIDREHGMELIREISRFASQPLIIDANEAYTNAEEVLEMMDGLSSHRVALIEQPLPAKMEAEYISLKKYAPYPVFADESACRNADINLLKQQFHGINMKLMKSGGYLAGIELLQQAKTAGMLTMIGCMVETSLGISAALQLSSLADYIDLDGFLIIQDEPFKLC